MRSHLHTNTPSPLMSIASQTKASSMVTLVGGRTLSLLLLLPFLLLPFAAAHNITLLLSQFPDFSTFNDLLTRTNISRQINSRRTITVLAVDNAAASRLTSLPDDALKAVLAVHVILDYYDTNKLRHLSRKATAVTTLYQTTGEAAAGNGFMNITKSPAGGIAFGSAAPDEPLVAAFEGEVSARPYNLSVIHVSNVIVPPDIGEEAIRSPPLPPNFFMAPPSPPPAPEAEAPAPSDDDSPATDAPAVAPAPKGPSPASAPGPALEVADDGEVSVSGRHAAAAGVWVVVVVGLLVGV